MSSWHQDQNPQPLWHATLFTVVTDPPGQSTSVERCVTLEQARAAMSHLPGSYILSPCPLKED